MDDFTHERWLPVVGYEGLYEASDLGRIKSLPRNTTRGGILKQSQGKDGRFRVHLTKHGKQPCFLVHRLVAAAFLGPRPEGMDDTRHLDGNPANNKAANLAYGTRADNMDDMVGHCRGNVSVTFCPKGHEYTPENTYRRGNQRWCRECARENGRKQGRRRNAGMPRPERSGPCPNCGATVDRAFPHQRRRFCSDTCLKAFRKSA